MGAWNRVNMICLWFPLLWDVFVRFRLASCADCLQSDWLGRQSGRAGGWRLEVEKQLKAGGYWLELGAWRREAGAWKKYQKHWKVTKKTKQTKDLGAKTSKKRWKVTHKNKNKTKIPRPWAGRPTSRGGQPRAQSSPWSVNILFLFFVTFECFC